MTTAFHTPAALRACFIAACCALAAPGALAINGSQLGGYGIKNAGMGGASIALPLDASAAANNPAGMAFVPSSFIANIVVLQGEASSNFVLPDNKFNVTVGQLAPEGGINYVISPEVTLGFSVSGGGASADFGRPLLPVPGAQTAVSTQVALEFIPNMTWKPRSDLALGAGLVLAQQQFSAQGVLAVTPGGLVGVPGHGIQTASGVGARIGVLWRATAQLALGATYKTLTPMGPLGEYAKDILAYSEGHSDIPPEFGVGIAWKPADAVTLAADWMLIGYSKVKLMQDPNGPLWQDQPVLRLGLAWDASAAWTLRTGASRNRRPMDSSRVLQNFLTPVIFETSYTAGATLRLDPTSDISMSLEFNPATTLEGTGPSTGSSMRNEGYVLRLGYQKLF